MLTLRAVDLQPFHATPYLFAASSGGTANALLPWLRGRVDGLPAGLSALLLASDLQGTAPSREGGAAVLLGVAVAEALDALDEAGTIPPLNRVGVVLAGDLFSAPQADRRGATGDVRAVWLELAARCRWVAGVAGNHDVFGDGARDAARFRASEGVHLLDGDGAVLDGLRIAGVGGVVGEAPKPGRRPLAAFRAALDAALATRPDVLALHEGPDVPDERLEGHPAIREALAPHGPLVVCGHTPWVRPSARLGRDGPTVLNVDGRVVLLERATP